ncbi:hypothetical protein AKJ62_02815 [candidate division MSBL1 archaeon SCGC-AAA259D14]|uniref:Small ribosomal subunit protein uS13 n=2 Tax=candidate division MSBL1 TaxID=215777 RepID=A0A133US08_9EURY|nr:hypothetical protein AKJ62_02815 [candidate division MSBL1 archaeon SCGC-AAA259D14]KXA96973.1 hypothetical protein AKJ38_02195 [candidate division MSBL1 archaeon SCGC-AAA259I14]
MTEEEKEEKKEEEQVKGIVRLAGRDLQGTRRVQAALTNLKGIAPSMARAIVYAAEIDGTRKIGSLDDDEIEKLNDVIQNPMEKGIPKWMANRRKDYESGDDLHILGGDIEMTEREDISREKGIQSRRGIRHQRGLPVRGQRTRSTGRKGMTVGVEREKLKKKAEESEES